MVNYLIKSYKKICFSPNILGLFLNPFYFVRTSIYRSVKRNAHELNGKILDFGCGNKPYRHLFKYEKYIGIDIDHGGHNHEEEPIDVYYDGKTIPFKNEYFDSCFSSQVFEHIFDLEHSLKEIHRVLKPNGKCLLIVPFIWDEHEIPYDFARYSSFGLIYLLEKSGFKIIKHEKDSHFVEVLAQLWCLYLYDILQTKNRYISVLINIFFISPFILMGWVLKTIAPRNYNLYFNNVVIAQKI